MAAVKFYFRYLVIVLFILCANARSYKHTNNNPYPSSHEQSGHASKSSYPNSSGISGDKKSHQSYLVSSSLSGSGQLSSSYSRSSGLSGTGSRTRKTESSYPPSRGFSGNSYPPSPGLSGQASKISYPTSSGLSGDKKSDQSYPVSGGLSGSGRPSPSYPGSSGLSETGSGNTKPASSYPPSSGLSGNSYPPSPGLSGQASKISYPTSSGLSGDKKSDQSYPVSSGLSGSGQLSSSYPGSSGLSGTGSGTTKPMSSYPPSSGISGNSNPPSPGLSGQASKISYPTSSGLSGDKKSDQSYPVSGGLSGSGRPSPSYPGSSGLSGTGSGTRKPEPSYPSSNGLSGNAPSTSSAHPRPTIIYPVANPSQNMYPHSNDYFVYKPPPKIQYIPAYEKRAVSYPVYIGSEVPSYVYKYRASDNKYKMLLAGLALYNLGMVSANPSIYNYHKHYAVRSDEVCKFGVRYGYGSYEDMVIDCRAITNFIWEDQSKPKATQQVVSQTIIVTTNVQTQTLLPNGTLGYPGFGGIYTILSPNGTLLNTTNTIITTNTTVSDSKYRGKSVAVSSDMECYILRYTSFSSMRKTIPCELLKTYAEQSLRNNVVNIKSPAVWILIIMIIALSNFK